METYQIILLIIYFMCNTIICTLSALQTLFEYSHITLGGFFFLLIMMFLGTPMIIISLIVQEIEMLKYKKQ